MQDVVFQLMGFGLVPRYVIKANGVEGTLQREVRLGSAIISFSSIIQLEVLVNISFFFIIFLSLY